MSYRNLLIIGLFFSFLVHLFLLKIFTFVANPIPLKNKPTIIFLGAVLQRKDISPHEYLSPPKSQANSYYEPKINLPEEYHPFHFKGPNKKSQSAHPSSKKIDRESTLRFITGIPTEPEKKGLNTEPATESYKPLRLEINDKN